MLSAVDIEFLRKACALAYLSPKQNQAFAVGAILVNPSGDILAEGYSRMDNDCCHAEEVIFERLRGEDLRGCILYSSMQPCYRRLSGRRSCQDYIIEAGLGKVIYAVREPNYFVEHGGDGLLLGAGIDVICGDIFLDEVRGANLFVEEWE